MRLLLSLAVLLALALPAQGAGRYEVKVDGKTRSFVVEAPLGPRPAPAIIVLPAEGDTADRMRKIASFQISGEGWAEVYPEALDGAWNDGQEKAPGKPFSKADDLAFMRAIIDKLAGDGIVDPGKVFFAGVSNGGTLALRVACEAPELAAGVAVVVAGQPPNLECVNGPPRPMLFIHSETDPLLPFKGGPVLLPGGGERGTILPLDETMARLALRNHCGYRDEFAIHDGFDDGTHVRMRVWRGCEKPLRQFIISGAGHTWPGNLNRARVEQALGHTSIDISATYEIEAFFKEALQP